MPLSIAHLSFSQVGGAGSVATALCKAQNVAGHESVHLWSISSDLRTQPFTKPFHTLAAGVDHYLVKAPDFRAPVSVFRDSLQDRFPRLLDEFDIIHLHNVNGLVDLSSFGGRYSEKKIVWTLHDMNPFTGACHYSLGCQNYISECSRCPAVRNHLHPLVSKRFQFKKESLTQLRRLEVVSPSEWLASAASKSPVLSRFPITVIPNPVGASFSKDPNPNTRFSFCLVAQNLDDPVKNVREVVENFSLARAQSPSLTLALVGAGGESFEGPGITRFGPLDHQRIATLFSETRALIVNSLAENAPLVIIEAASVGCFPVVRKVGGMPGMIDQLQSGYQFSCGSELKELLTRFSLKDDAQTFSSRQALAARAKELFSPSTIARQYDEVYVR